MLRVMLSYLTDLGLFFFVAQAVIFSIGGGVPFYGAIVLLFFSLFIKIARDNNFLGKLVAIAPRACGREALQRLFARDNAALFINGVFLMTLGVLTVLDIIFNFNPDMLFQKILLAANGFGYGMANMRKSAELDGLWVLPNKTTIAGNIIASLSRPECISVYSTIPASILGSAIGTWMILPLLIPAFLFCIKTGIEEFDNVFLSQPKRVVAARMCIGLSNCVVGSIALLDGRMGAGIGLFMFFIGNCGIAYRTYQVQQKQA